MPAQKRAFIALNVAGGLAVLASYAWGVLAHPGAGGQVWGGVPEALKPLYTVSMLLAAAGYFPFTAFLLFRTDTRTVRIFGRLGFGAVNAFYAAILLPSALWMPLTFRMLAAPDPELWVAIRAVLAAVGLASLALLAGYLTLAPVRRGVLYWLGAIGLVAFCFQTALLDAVVWPACFPRPPGAG
jgi:hypothetical protein